jgi:hypothetical protein
MRVYYLARVILQVMINPREPGLFEKTIPLFLPEKRTINSIFLLP